MKYTPRVTGFPASMGASKRPCAEWIDRAVLSASQAKRRHPNRFPTAARLRGLVGKYVHRIEGETR